jgi:hypothetical protein
LSLVIAAGIWMAANFYNKRSMDMMNWKLLLKQVIISNYGALLFSCSTESEFQIKDGIVYYKSSTYKDLRYHENFQKLDADANTFRILNEYGCHNGYERVKCR